MRPSFLIIGSPKCGTTTLWSVLRHHPQVYLSRCKEPSFFADHYDRGWAWYERLFDGAAGYPAVGEASPAYTASHADATVARRIADGLPEAKLVYLVRHPLRKIASEWLQAQKQSRRTVHRDFATAVQRTPGLVDTGDFAAKLALYDARFPPGRIHVMFLEDYEADPRGELARLCRFLNVDATWAATAELAWENRAGEQRLDRSFTGHLRRVPGLEHVAANLPAPIVTAARRLVKRPMVRPMWTPDAWQFATARLAVPTRDLLARCGKPADYWRFEDVLERPARRAA